MPRWCARNAACHFRGQGPCGSLAAAARPVEETKGREALGGGASGAHGTGEEGRGEEKGRGASQWQEQAAVSATWEGPAEAAVAAPHDPRHIKSVAWWRGLMATPCPSPSQPMCPPLSACPFRPVRLPRQPRQLQPRWRSPGSHCPLEVQAFGTMAAAQVVRTSQEAGGLNGADCASASARPHWRTRRLPGGRRRTAGRRDCARTADHCTSGSTNRLASATARRRRHRRRRIGLAHSRSLHRRRQHQHLRAAVWSSACKNHFARRRGCSSGGKSNRRAASPSGAGPRHPHLPGECCRLSGWPGLAHLDSQCRTAGTPRS